LKPALEAIEAAMKSALPISLWLALALCGSAFAQPAPASPAEMISNYRVQHGEGPVTSDATLNRIAHEQAAAMASKDMLDHNSALAPFASRVAAAKSQRSAENIAYGYDTFPKTLDMWIDSPAHQKNLLMPGALKVGVASAKSSKTHRTYWAMVITSGERPQSASSAAHRATPHRDEEACRLKILGLCL
jgi:Cysteine-rich secretory protein family